MKDKPSEGGQKSTPRETLQARAPNLFDLLDLLLAIRLGLCMNGNPAFPVATLTPEAIKNLGDIANRAIAVTSGLVARVERDVVPGASRPPKSIP